MSENNTNSDASTSVNATFAETVTTYLHKHVLDCWFPACIDREHGGFHQTFSRTWQPKPDQNRWLVFQTRMVWLAAKVCSLPGINRQQWKAYIDHGTSLIRERLVDHAMGGLFLSAPLDRPADQQPDTRKHAYSISFAIYGAAAAFHATGDESHLEDARRWFIWLDAHAHDPEHGGYFEALNRDGTPIATEQVPGQNDMIGHPLGLKSLNSHIHLLESFTELLHAKEDALVRERLTELHHLIAHRLWQQSKCLPSFYDADWQPRSKHVDYGHEIETGFLLTESAEVLGLLDDPDTLQAARALTDHALDAGWDGEFGGLYNGGEIDGRIVDQGKNWWAQAEALNTTLLMDSLYGHETPQYREAFERVWKYIDEHFIDDEHHGWWGNLSRRGELQPPDDKGWQWKAAYHDGRALMNVANQLQKQAEG